jgi:hypothetical protein
VAAPVDVRASCTAAAGHRIAAVDVLVDGAQAWHAAPSAGLTAQVLPAVYPTATGAHTLTVRGTDETGATSTASIGIQLTSSGWDPWLQVQGARVTSGRFAGAFMINPAADAINWYFANVGLLGFADRFPAFARAHVDAYLAAKNADATIDDVDHPLAATPTLKPPDSDDSYAATLLSLAARYVNVTDDLAWFQANLGALKAVATNNLLHAQQSNGLVHVFQDPNHLALNAYTEDNCEVYKGLQDFAGLLSRIGDADASTYSNAATAVASAIHRVLFIATAPNGPSSGPGFSVVWNGATNPLQPAANAPGDYYPRGVTQLFPAAYQVPMPAADNDAAWNYAGGQFPSWWSTIYDPPASQGGASDPFAVAGYGAAVRGQSTQATGVQQLVRSNVANGIAVPINDFGFYERITQVLNGDAPY